MSGGHLPLPASFPMARARSAARRRRGFNLVELLIALAISSALLTATMVALDASFRAYQATTEQASTNTIARLTMNRILTLIRTGEEFGPFPVNPLVNTVEEDFIQFSLDGDVVEIRWYPDEEALRVNVGGQSHVLLEGVIAQYDPPNSTADEDRIRPFTLEYQLGNRLYRATVNLMVVPDDNLSTTIDGDNFDVIHLVASAMPRTAAYQ